MHSVPVVAVAGTRPEATQTLPLVHVAAVQIAKKENELLNINLSACIIHVEVTVDVESNVAFPTTHKVVPTLSEAEYVALLATVNMLFHVAAPVTFAVVVNVAPAATVNVLFKAAAPLIVAPDANVAPFTTDNVLLKVMAPVTVAVVVNVAAFSTINELLKVVTPVTFAVDLNVAAAVTSNAVPTFTDAVNVAALLTANVLFKMAALFTVACC